MSFNMTRREAMQRAEVHNARIVWNREWQEYTVSLNEWSRKERERMQAHTDDLEDAVHTAGRMRREAVQQGAMRV